ncbi:uncharacterized protein UTRI_01795 [Ustilago trichophora]|uniref:WD40 repeat-like protein n=1 Tax=Ustilago trichophora TaxID=86804 RepID=A0A5C3E0N8_9BASI|nr:uncharacterized protein UTRI_01795 [Ustilago trichophora]
MQTTSNATLFQTSYSEALGAYRSRKAIHTSGLVSISSTSCLDEVKARYGYPIHLHPRFEEAVVKNAQDLAVEGSGADGGRYRVLSLQVDNERGYIWTSESGGIVRQLDGESGKTVNTYRGAKAPVPTFDFLKTKAGEKLLVTGSWDKALRIYRVSNSPNDKSAATPLLELPDAMADFIKSVHIFESSNTTYIAAAGSDKSIMLFDVTPLLTLPTLAVTVEAKLKCIYQNKSHTRPVNVLASLVGLDGITRLYSADSMGRVLESTLNPTTLRLEVQREIRGFSTAVYDLKAGWRRVEVEGEASSSPSSSGGGDAFVSEVKEDEEGGRYQLVAEVWAASGDKTVAGYRLSPSLQSSSNKISSRIASSSTTNTPLLGNQEPLSLPYAKIAHQDFVKSVLPLALHLSSSSSSSSSSCSYYYDTFSQAVLTGGSDEHLRLHSPFSEDENVVEIEGHWHEITSLALWFRSPSVSASNSSLTVLPKAKNEELWVVSAGLDGSIRRWNLNSIARLPKPDLKPVLEEKARELGGDWDQNSLPPVTINKRGEDAVVGLQMTAEEEAELAELMSDDD